MGFERESMLVCVALLVQVLGLVGVVAARLSQRSGAGRWSVVTVVACVVLVGVVSLGTMETCERGWLIFATTLPLMAVGATFDVRKSAAGAAF